MAGTLNHAMSDAAKHEQRLAAAAVHTLTASGVVWAFLALIAAVRADWPMMFAWLGVALIVDGVDGPLARKVGIARVLPGWNGEILDLVVDYLTYAFIPAYAALSAGLFPDNFGLVGAAIICLSSAGFFAKRDQKSADNYFIGFPAVWNLVLFYWMVFDSGPELVMASTVALGLLTFFPILFIHPVRVSRFRNISLAVTAISFVLALITVVQDLAPPEWVRIGLAAALVYLLGVSLWRTLLGAAK
ncbi:phosphatidylcholine synthase [Microbaculum marinum]|uniref:Phosphatidylcholine synthase n=1 Tax=Microbaculum marinum TaxID=1764581 RepID=A0AAW9S0U0_9HYPH